jgi:metal-responsive CopG/Arc/MetJ family transcriptional regulator
MIKACRYGLMSDDTMLSIRIPRELVAHIDEIVDRQVLGFGSRIEFVADAIRKA